MASGLWSYLRCGKAYPLANYRTALANDARCFPETGQCISGRFRSFWEENGGLPVFGYPIAAPAQRLIATTASPTNVLARGA